MFLNLILTNKSKIVFYKTANYIAEFYIHSTIARPVLKIEIDKINSISLEHCRDHVVNESIVSINLKHYINDVLFYDPSDSKDVYSNSYEVCSTSTYDYLIVPNIIYLIGVNENNQASNICNITFMLDTSNG